ncbi:hypothetical protein IAT40_006691 [Kwoniella sp. CBS 6097]
MNTVSIGVDRGNQVSLSKGKNPHFCAARQAIWDGVRMTSTSFVGATSTGLTKSKQLEANRSEADISTPFMP